MWTAAIVGAYLGLIALAVALGVAWSRLDEAAELAAVAYNCRPRPPAPADGVDLQRLATADGLAALASRVTTCEADGDRLDRAVGDVGAALAEAIERLNEVQADARTLRESVGRLETRADDAVVLIDMRPTAENVARELEDVARRLRGSCKPGNRNDLREGPPQESQA